MDFKGLKDQVSDKTKTELLGKVDELKDDISQKLGQNSGNQQTQAQNNSQDIDGNVKTGSIDPQPSSKDEVEEPEEDSGQVEATADDEDVSADTDDSKEEAA